MWEMALIAFDRITVTYLRWSIILGGMFVFFWLYKPKWAEKPRIRQFIQAKTIIWKEIPRSIRTLSWYMLPVFTAMYVGKHYGYTKRYTDFSEMGFGYWLFTIVLFFIAYDTCFYWTHRFLHLKRVYKHTHSVHHQSINVNPLSGYSLDIVEGFLITLPHYLIMFTIPWHFTALITFGTLGMIWTGYIHLGYELLPKGKENHPIYKWLYSAEHHLLHHQKYTMNFGLYFTFWDKLCKTEAILHADGRVGPPEPLRAPQQKPLKPIVTNWS